jgi:hypothetical protein
MGLGELSYLANVSPSIYAGLSAYGALSGERGGFFTGGLEVGTGVRYGRVLVDAGLFVDSRHAAKSLDAGEVAGYGLLQGRSRLVQQPRRLWRRMFVSAPIFLWHVLRERIRGLRDTQSR